jgi:hypothetical protein
MNDPQKNAAGEHVFTAQQEKILAGVERKAPSKFRLFLRAYSASANKREVIKSKCLDCSHLNVVEVRQCTATGCPLWRYRPYQEKG